LEINMFNVNGIPATLIQNNRNESSVYDDQDKQEVDIKVCPYKYNTYFPENQCLK